MEGHRHDAVCGIERLLHSIAMVDVNVHIQDTAASRGVLREVSYQYGICCSMLSYDDGHPGCTVLSQDSVLTSNTTAATVQQAATSNIPLVLLEQLQNRQHNVVDVAKAAGLGLLCMMHAAWCDITACCQHCNLLQHANL